MRRTNAYLVLGCIVALAAAACGDDDPNTSSTTATTSGSGGAAVGGAGGMAGAGGATTTGAGGESSTLTLSNTDYAQCGSRNAIGAILPGEKGHFYASRLTPDAYPATIERVEYAIVETTACDATLAHELHLMVVSATAPSASPSADATLVAQEIVTPPTAVDEVATVTHTLGTPIVLQDGESLIVSIEMESDAANERGICVETCEDTQVPAVDYWSNSATEPYSWEDMVATLGILANTTVRAFGVN